MNIIVFGSCGFIGGSVVHYYKNSPGIKVLAIDILEKEEQDYYCYKKNDPEFERMLVEWMPDIIINAAGAANV
ncbi:MAG TPA: NAD-dependent epimerase/dehydratase family protein, partial [Flavisolibacter sp.]|nr:NAD-dependent epimerase/dehydratase family protein [Flavisolibacter sp.]